MATRPLPKFKCPSEAQLEALACDLDKWFEGKKRGRGSRVIACERPDGIWFLVRHGEPLKREESIDGLETSSTSTTARSSTMWCYLLAGDRRASYQRSLQRGETTLSLEIR